ncbi:MAG: hypothetical protein ACKO96_12970, partial [Flammeovirgaceae bacterium]
DSVPENGNDRAWPEKWIASATMQGSANCKIGIPQVLTFLAFTCHSIEIDGRVESLAVCSGPLPTPLTPTPSIRAPGR